MKARIFISIALLCVAEATVAQPPARPCLARNPRQFDRLIQRVLIKPIGEIPISYLYTDLQNIQASCSEKIKELQIEGCFDRLNGYISQFASSKSGMYSATMTDQEYLAIQPADTVELPTEFKMAAHGLPKNWKEIASKKGWKWVHFNSGTGNQARLVMLIPGEKFDRLLVYYTDDSTNSDPTTYQGVQMQAIEKTSQEDVSSLPKYYFRSWGFGEHSVPEVKSLGGRCVNCHLNGPRAVFPYTAPGGFTTQLGGVASVEEFNKLIIRERPLDYSPYYDLQHFPTKMQLGSNSQCTECHDGTKRNSLAFSIDRNGDFAALNIHRKVAIEKTMPKSAWWQWSDRERNNLDDQITKEYYENLKSWLTETTCKHAAEGKPTEPAIRNLPPAVSRSTTVDKK